MKRFLVALAAAALLAGACGGDSTPEPRALETEGDDVLEKSQAAVQRAAERSQAAVDRLISENGPLSRLWQEVEDAVDEASELVDEDTRRALDRARAGLERAIERVSGAPIIERIGSEAAELRNAVNELADDVTVAQEVRDLTTRLAETVDDTLGDDMLLESVRRAIDRTDAAVDKVAEELDERSPAVKRLRGSLEKVEDWVDDQLGDDSTVKRLQAAIDRLEKAIDKLLEDTP